MTTAAAAVQLLKHRVQRIVAMETTVGQGRWGQAGDFLASNLSYRVGARPPTYGVDAFRQYMELQFSVVDWIGHTTHLEALSQDQDAVIIEVTSHFRRKVDGVDFDLPCCDIYRFDGDDKICDWRVYSDIQLLGLPDVEESGQN